MINKERTIKEVDEWLEGLPENIQKMTLVLRKLILDASPKLKEEYKWSMPNYSNNGLVCYLQTAKKHVNLGFHQGIELEEIDVHHLLQGSGKTMRHIQIKKMEDIQPDLFTSFIQAAVAINEK